jgi:hypothetical protein
VSEGQLSQGANAKWHRHIANSEVHELELQGIVLKVVRTRGCESTTEGYQRLGTSGLGSWRTKCWRSQIAKSRESQSFDKGGKG